MPFVPNIDTPHSSCATLQGCGLVTLETHAAAAAALDALNTKYTWPGMQSPMVVKWMDATLQSRRREHHIMAAAQSNPILPMGMTASGVAGLASLPLIQAQVGSYAAPQLLPPQLQGMHSAGLIQAGGQSLRHAPDGVLVHNAQLSQVSYLSAPHSSAWGLQAARTASGSEVRLPQAGLQHGQGGRGMASRQYLQGRNQHGATGRSVCAEEVLLSVTLGITEGHLLSHTCIRAPPAGANGTQSFPLGSAKHTPEFSASIKHSRHDREDMQHGAVPLHRLC
jgi:hypothetical protein